MINQYIKDDLTPLGIAALAYIAVAPPIFAFWFYGVNVGVPVLTGVIVAAASAFTLYRFKEV